MSPTEILSHEHRLIERVLRAVERAVAAWQAGTALDGQFLERALEFFRQFADRCHHGKEEHLLFELLEQRGIARQGGPIGVMVQEHQAGRDCLTAVESRLAGAASGLAEDRQAVLNNLTSYIQLLDQHIDKEDHCLFVMAEQALTREDRDRLLEQFEQFEDQQMPPGAHERLARLADELSARAAAITRPA